MNEPVLQARGVTKSFPPATTVLRGIDLTVQRGEILAVTGASGAGKSTLLHILGGLERPDSGQVLLEGQDLFTLGDTRLSRLRNRSLGFVFQFHFLLNEFTMLENVMLPGMIHGTPREKLRHRARRLLKRMGLGERLEHRPNELSGGEQQRAALARALINEPLLVLADEPTGNLDSRNTQLVRDLIRDLAEEFGQTFILVTHNHNLAEIAHHRRQMLDGRFLD